MLTETNVYSAAYHLPNLHSSYQQVEMNNIFTQRKLTGWLLRETNVSGVRRVASLRGALASEIGNVRSDNQDKAIVFRGATAVGRPYAVAVVADGIGGMKDGAKCASLAIASFTSALSELVLSRNTSLRDCLFQAATLANEAVYSDFLGRGGSTLVAVMFVPGRPPLWVSAGDSRIYLHTKKALKLLTVDDTIAGQLNKVGRVPPEHSKILQFVGMGKDFEPHIGEVIDASEGQLVLTTDGVHYLEDGSDWFKNVMQYAPDPAATAKRLIDVAKWCGGPDNATLAVIEFPVQLSENVNIDDGLQVWDAFGELHIQLQFTPPPIQSYTPMVSKKGSPPEEVLDRVEDDDELELLEDIEPKIVPAPKKRSPRKKAASKAKPDNVNKQDEQEAPKLDFKFSTKAKD
jgi:serine/threonine protein phosphatase PrpC